MTKRIYKAICAAALGVFVVTLVLILGVLYNYFTAVQLTQLRTQTALAVQGAEQGGTAWFDNYSGEELRITWIAPDGSVLYDNTADSGNMENHLYRPEIRQALAEGSGESARYSPTLMKQYLYCARRLTDGSVLRLSVSHSSSFVLLLGMLQPILVIIFVAAVLSFVLANSLSKKIVEPMNRLNLEQPLENEGYDELSPLLRRIHSQQVQLKQQTTALTQKQNELDAIVGNLTEGMILLDRQGAVITANQAALHLLDANQLRIAGVKLLTLNRDPELQAAIQDAMEGMTATRKTVLRGRTIRIQAACVGVEEQMSGVAVVLFDITEQEQAESRRREFTANVSHELKTPLQSISGYSELLKCGLTKPEDVQPFGERIYGETQRLIALVEDIINLSHLDEGDDYAWQELDLCSQALSVSRELAQVAREKQVTLTQEGSSLPMRGIPELVHTILYNLCDNAIKYNRPGGSVTLRVSREAGFAVAEVSDTGIGIPEEEQDRIFERFYRVDKGRSREVGGTGLGLSIVKHAAMLHNAPITVESREGEGTTIRIRFPAGTR